MEFKEWLVKEKQYSDRASRDVQSRIKRTLTLINESKISDNTLSKLESNLEFNEISISVKSQLRRAVKLYQEYILSNNR